MNPLRFTAHRQVDNDREEVATFLTNKASQYRYSRSEVAEQDTSISPQPARGCITPMTYGQERVRDASLSAHALAKDKRARGGTLDCPLEDFPFSESGVLDARLDTECHVPSPKSQFTDVEDSPLFVPKEKIPLSSSLIPHLASTPSSANSNNDSVSRYIRHSQGGRPVERDPLRVGSVEKTVMGDVFLKSDYVKTLQNNPYTSGIFAYEGKEKKAYEGADPNRKKRRRLDEDLESGTNAVLDSASLPRVGTHRSPQTLSRNEQLSTPLARNRRGSQSGYATTIKAPALMCHARRSSLQSGGLQATRQAAHRARNMPNTRNLITSRPEASRDSSNLATFFFEKAYACEKALSDVGCSYETNKHEWDLLDESLAADIQMFVQKLHSSKDVDSELKINLQAWDTNMSIRALLQKYKMYTSLLKATVQ